MATRVQSLAESGIERIPAQYVWPGLHSTINSLPHHPQHIPQIPVIDLHGLRNPNSHLEEDIVAQISSAAENWGFFVIVNHGIPESLSSRVQEVGEAFFQLPLEEKELYKAEGGNPIGYGSRVGTPQDAKLEWKDYYYNVVLPVEQRDVSKWPKKPSDFSDVMDEYGREVCKLYKVLMKGLSIGLGLKNENTLEEAVGGERMEIHVAINYYPPSPQPDLAMGLAPHSDANAVTILLHNQVPGLQIYKDGAWVTVQCIPGSLVVNIGDQLEVLSNGKYKSIEHRGCVNKDQKRMSWAMHCTPPLDMMISPLKELIDDQNPQLYEGFCFQDYVKRYFTKGLDGKGQIWSNGKYKSIEYRCCINKGQKKMSCAMHCTLPLDMRISPLKELIDDHNPQLYEGFCFKDYIKIYFTKGLDGKEKVNEQKL